jgi:hypothetical protein
MHRAQPIVIFAILEFRTQLVRAVTAAKRFQQTGLTTHLHLFKSGEQTPVVRIGVLVDNSCP